MPPERRREIQAMGRKACREKYPELHRTIAQVGGLTTSADRAHMSRIGRLGGRARKAEVRS